MKRRSVLIPTDFSENAHNALRYALSLFAQTTTDFHLVHIKLPRHLHQLYRPANHPVKAFPKIKNPKTLLEKEIRRAKSLTQNPSHHFFATLEKGALVETLRRKVTEKKVDYIVMGTKGGSASNSKKIGNNSSKVIAKVKCPTFIVPEHARFYPEKTIAFPLDFNNLEKETVLNPIRDILSLKNTALHLGQITNKGQKMTALQKENKDFLVQTLIESDYCFHHLDNSNIALGVQKLVDEHNIGLVIVVGKNINILRHLLFQKKTIQYHLNIPFLILHQ